MTDLAQIKDGLTRDNALERLREIPCSSCGTVGDFGTYDVPANNGVALQCLSCGQRHPFISHGIQFLPIDPNTKRRSNDIAAVVNACGDYCYGCGKTREELARLSLALTVHHTRPFAEHGEQYAKVPLCSLCHEIVSGGQRLMARLMKLPWVPQ